MGQILSEPVTSKQSHSLCSSRLVVGSSCMQGWRVSMEDAHTHILQLPSDPDASFFAVFDGHGGAKVAEFASLHLHQVLAARPEYVLGEMSAALQQACLQLDQLMLVDEQLKDVQAGSTVIAVLIKNNVLYCANVGDSRAVASVDGGRVDVLSLDHKPSLAAESRRITAAGGWVEADRVNGNLALSRALGDFAYKAQQELPPHEQIVTAWPDIEMRQLTDDWEFIVLACDGIWDVLTNQEVVQFVRCRLAGGMEPSLVCEQLMTRCLAPDCFMAGLGCDNMSVILVCLLHESDAGHLSGLQQRLAGKCARPKSAGATAAGLGDGVDDGHSVTSSASSSSVTPDISPTRSNHETAASESGELASEGEV